MKIFSLCLILILPFFIKFEKLNTIVVEKQIYNVFEYKMKLDKVNGNVYYSHEKCYSANIEIKKGQKSYVIEIENNIHKFEIISVKSRNKKGYTVLVAKIGNPQLYLITESYVDNELYLIVKPVRFNTKYAIDDAGLVISKKPVCGSYF